MEEIIERLRKMEEAFLGVDKLTGGVRRDESGTRRLKGEGRGDGEVDHGGGRRELLSLSAGLIRTRTHGC